MAATTSDIPLEVITEPPRCNPSPGSILLDPQGENKDEEIEDEKAEEQRQRMEDDCHTCCYDPTDPCDIWLIFCCFSCCSSDDNIGDCCHCDCDCDDCGFDDCDCDCDD